MRKFVIAAFLLMWMPFGQSACSHEAKAAKSAVPQSKIDIKVEALLKTLSVKDKVGEMTQLSIDMISIGNPYNLAEPHQLDVNRLQNVLVDLRVGSILNCGGHEYTREHWHKIIGTIQEYAAKKDSKIPVLYGIDAIHGTNYTTGSTLFPQQIGQAATWNPDLVQQAGEITAYETRASCIPWNFSPVMDIGRNPIWPRLWETYGEDVYLASRMGEAAVKGYQGQDPSSAYNVAACLKHFLGYSTPITGKDRTQAWIPERQLKEYFAPTFQAGIDAGALSVMINSGEMNGIPVHANPKILVDLLRGEMGFKGVAVTDWEDIKYLVSRHKIAKDYKEAIKISINAGIDMSMVPMDLDFPVLLKELVDEGEVPMSRIDEAVRRILTMKFQLGLFENPVTKFEDYPDFGSAKFAAAAKQTALESITLLKNEDDILPLAKAENIMVAGLTSNSLNALNGGWSHTWQGTDPKWNTKGKLTVKQALQSEFGRSVTAPQADYETEYEAHLQQALNLGKQAKTIVLCVGEMPYTEVVGNIDDLDLDKQQQNFAEQILALGKPTVLLYIGGRPRVITDLDAQAKATVMAYLPGDEGAPAIADILSGNVNPSGKLPFTYPRFSNTLITYDYKGTDKVKQDFSMNAINPLYEFGHGLSYTNFKYSNLKLSSTNIGMDDALTVSVSVTNTGEIDGKEVVQLYVADKVASITPSAKRLRAFDKLNLKAGESQTVEFTITPKDLAFVGINNKWITEPGEFEVQIGGLTETFRLE